MAICIEWAQIRGADVTGYKLYRSIIGFIANNAQGASIDGLDLVLDMNDTGEQTFVFNDTDDAKTTINRSIEGGHAFDSVQDESKFILRSNTRDETGSVTIVRGTAMNALGITPRRISELSEDHLITTQESEGDDRTIYRYTDEDGVVEDWYAITTVDSNQNESRKTEYKQSTESTGSLCVVSGIVTDLQGARIADAVVEAKIMDFDQTVVDEAYVSTDVITTLSNDDGRWQLALLQNTLVQLNIDAVGYRENVRIPELSYVEWTDLEITQEHRWRVP